MSADGVSAASVTPGCGRPPRLELPAACGARDTASADLRAELYLPLA